MLSVDNLEPNSSSSSQFLSPKFPSTRQSLSARRSSASLRGQSSSSQNVEEDNANGRHHSLAHELAVALMPEPSAGSKLLAEEFGIEYDEGAEGIDEGDQNVYQARLNKESSFVDEIMPQSLELEDGRVSPSLAAPVQDAVSDIPTSELKRANQPEQDAMDILARNIESTDKFLSHLRHLDVDSPPSLAQPTLETIALDVIRRINDTSRDREEQLRALFEYEREFRRIAGEVGGSDVLGQLDELTGVEDLSDEAPPLPVPKISGRLEPLQEEVLDSGNDWETELDQHQLGDEMDDSDEPLTPTKITFAPLPPIHGPPTPSKTIPRLADLRTFTSSLVVSLTTISEQAQVNGAATTEAGRKLRALKNKLGEWRMDWDSAEISRLKIERWESGIEDADCPNGTPKSPRSSLTRRVDGRKVVREHLQAFESALAEAAVKTKSIMATS